MGGKCYVKTLLEHVTGGSPETNFMRGRYGSMSRSRSGSRPMTNISAWVALLSHFLPSPDPQPRAPSEWPDRRRPVRAGNGIARADEVIE